MNKQLPAHICDSCGNKARELAKVSGDKDRIVTYHISTCDICGDKNVDVREVRDYGYKNIDAYLEKLKKEEL